MLRLEATLIATMVARPWRTGWTLDRGVDFVVQAPMPQMVAPPDIARAAAEPVSFLDAEEIMPGSKVVRRYVSLAARKAGAAAEDRTERPLARAWSSVARKVPGS